MDSGALVVIAHEMVRPTLLVGEVDCYTGSAIHHTLMPSLFYRKALHHAVSVQLLTTIITDHFFLNVIIPPGCPLPRCRPHTACPSLSRIHSCTHQKRQVSVNEILNIYILYYISMLTIRCIYVNNLYTYMYKKNCMTTYRMSKPPQLHASETSSEQCMPKVFILLIRLVI